MSFIVDEEFDGGFDDIAVAEFRNATAGEFDLFADGDALFDLLDSFKDRAFAFFDL